MLHVLAAGFLIGPEQDPDPAFQGHPAVLQGLQGIKGGGGGAFVIHGAPAVDILSVRFPAVGIPGPAIPFRHHIQVSQDGHHFRAFPIFTPAHVIVHILGPEAHFFRFFQHIGQTPGRTFSKRLAGNGRFLHTLDPYRFLQGLYHCFPIAVYQFCQIHCTTSC